MGSVQLTMRERMALMALTMEAVLVTAYQLLGAFQQPAGVPALALGDVLRVSGAGIERYQGVPMWVLAIDDAGDLLMHSRKNPRLDRETLLPPDPPRNLYVLAQDGELARVDGLEPDPERSVGIVTGSYRWITARSL